MKNIKEIEEYLKRWPMWIAIVMLFIPGILYQIQEKSVNLSNFEGSLIIIFLILSLYYSLLFIVGGFFIFVAGKKNIFNKIAEEDFFLISIYSIIFYSFSNFFSELSGGSVWYFYWGILIIFLIKGRKNWRKILKKERLNL
jgi:cation transport ATPase